MSIQFGGPMGLIEKTEKLRKENYEIEFGKEEDDGKREGGIVQLQSQLAEVLLDRGRLWNDAQPLSLSEDDVLILEVTQPKTYRIEKNVPLYIFEEKTFLEGGRYLGMFFVEEVIGNATDEESDPTPGGKVQVTLRPGWPISEGERNRLSASVNNRDLWRLYDKTPVDRHQAFAGLEADDMKIDEEEFSTLNREDRLRKILPPDSADEFIEDYQPFIKPVEFESIREFIKEYDKKNGKYPRDRIEVGVKFLEALPARQNDDEEEDLNFAKGQEVWLGIDDVVARRSVLELLDVSDDAAAKIELIDEEDSLRYSRKLRDYAYLFRDFYRKGQSHEFEISEKMGEIEGVKQVKAEKAKVIAQFREEKARLKNDSAQFSHEQKILESLTNSLSASRKAVDTALKKVRQETIRLGEELNTKQLKAIRDIDRRAPDPGTPAGAG
ncbi:MAG: hypothetical protein P8K78_05425 [Pirellulales bacterium]|nr:hypothetical protein [Pirellulales bacterium]